jgi:hypothetical protein
VAFNTGGKNFDGSQGRYTFFFTAFESWARVRGDHFLRYSYAESRIDESRVGSPGLLQADYVDPATLSKVPWLLAIEVPCANRNAVTREQRQVAVQFRDTAPIVFGLARTCKSYWLY